MSSMKGLVVTDFGAPSDVIKLSKELSIPELNEEKGDEILVQVYYASIHVGDWKISNGNLGIMAKLMGFKPPYTPGQDYSGKVVKVGKNVENFKVGDFVYGEVRMGHGTAAEYIIVTEEKKEIFKLPQGDNFRTINMMEAAALQVSLETAYQSIVDYAEFEKGQSILILGGSTVIGMHLIQIAKNHFESKAVYVTSSSVDLCKSLGADEVINYKESEWEKVLKDANLDVIIDVMGGSKSWKDCQNYNVLKPGGKFVAIAGDFGDGDIGCCQMCSFMCCAFICRQCCCVKREYHAVNQQVSKDIETAVELLVAGKVKVIIDDDAPYALEDYLQLYEKSIARKAHGKMLLKFYDDADEDKNTETAIKVDEEEQKYNEE